MVEQTDAMMIGASTSAASRVRRRRAFTALGLVALVLLGVLTWFVVHDPRPQASAGARYQDTDDVTAAYTQSLTLPWGRLTVGATKPRRALPRDYARYELHENPAPPDGGRFVGLTWKRDDEYSSHQASESLISAGVRTHLSVVADGHAYPVEDPQAAQAPCSEAECFDADTIWLAVKSSADHLLFAAEFGGVTQTVDLRTGARNAGAAETLYSTAPDTGTGGTDCGPARLPAGWTNHDDSDSPFCKISVTRLPYLPRFGWAAKGSIWVAVGLALEPPLFVKHRRATGPADVYQTSDAISTVAATVSGGRYRGPLAEPAAAALDSVGGYGQVLVFSASATVAGPTSVTVSAVVPLEPRPYDGGPARGPLTVAMSWTVSA